ncbi:hypothetical protein CRUP_021143 [Coryphaenoides rupestris]|nr:hypothetical protein CRUP_021143 [Coryphaenoides rupestris]
MNEGRSTVFLFKRNQGPLIKAETLPSASSGAAHSPSDPETARADDDVTLALSGFSDLFEAGEEGLGGELLAVPSGPAGGGGDGKQNLRSKFQDAFKKGIGSPMDLLDSYEASVAPGPKKAPMDSLFQYGTCRQESNQKRRRKKLPRGKTEVSCDEDAGADPPKVLKIFNRSLLFDCVSHADPEALEGLLEYLQTQQKTLTDEELKGT